MKITKFFLSLIIFFASTAQSAALQNSFDVVGLQDQKEINKEKLTKQIKSIICDEQIYELYVLINSETLHHYSQGNKELGEDIIDLHDSFINRDVAQVKLDEFCSKWGLENINISEVIRLGWRAIKGL